MEILIALLLVAALAWFVTAPLRRDEPAGEAEPPSEDPRRADLEARKQALYRQIRDAELDRAQGKLSDADWQRLDTELRQEAIALLRRIDALG